MKKIFFLLGVSGFIFSGCNSPKPAPAAPKQYSATQFYNNENVDFVYFKFKEFNINNPIN